MLDLYDGELYAEYCGHPIKDVYDDENMDEAVEMAIDEIANHLMACKGMTLDN